MITMKKSHSDVNWMATQATRNGRSLDCPTFVSVAVDVVLEAKPLQE
jgi:hypothetical protein